MSGFLANVQSVSLTAAGTSDLIAIDLNRYTPGVGLLVTLRGTTPTCTYTVQVTGDNINSHGVVGALNWNSHDTLAGMTASGNGNLAFPCTGVRLVADAISAGGTLTLNVVQANG